MLNSGRKTITLIAAVAPFFAALLASVHVHQHEHPSSPAANLSCDCAFHTHSHSENSETPFDTGHDCDECLLCHFSAQSSWFQPISVEVDAETISVSANEVEYQVPAQPFVCVYQGRAPPTIFSV